MRCYFQNLTPSVSARAERMPVDRPKSRFALRNVRDRPNDLVQETYCARTPAQVDSEADAWKRCARFRYLACVVGMSVLVGQLAAAATYSLDTKYDGTNMLYRPVGDWLAADGVNELIQDVVMPSGRSACSVHVSVSDARAPLTALLPLLTGMNEKDIRFKVAWLSTDSSNTVPHGITIVQNRWKTPQEIAAFLQLEETRRKRALKVASRDVRKTAVAISLPNDTSSSLDVDMLTNILQREQCTANDIVRFLDSYPLEANIERRNRSLLLLKMKTRSMQECARELGNDMMTPRSDLTKNELHRWSRDNKDRRERQQIIFDIMKIRLERALQIYSLQKYGLRRVPIEEGQVRPSATRQPQPATAQSSSVLHGRDRRAADSPNAQRIQN